MTIQSAYHQEYESLCRKLSYGQIVWEDFKEAVKALGIRYAL